MSASQFQHPTSHGGDAAHSLDQLVDSLPVLLSRVDANERYLFVNRAYADWFGRPVDAIVGSTLVDMLGADTYARVKPWVDAALSGRTVRFETAATYRKAGDRFIDATYTPSFDRSGAVDGFFVLVQDVTARQRAQDALALSQSQLSAALESVTDGFFTLDADARFVLLNSAGERCFEVSREEVIGRRLFDVFPSLANSAFEPMLRAALRGEHPSSVETDSPIRAGHRVSARASPLTDGGIAVSFTDVTERWRAEMARETSERMAREQLEELEAIYESSPVGLAFLTNDLRFVRVNRRLAAINGVPAADHLGRTVRDVVPSIADQVDDILARLRAGEEIVSHEVIGETPASPGVQGAWLEYWTPLRGPDGEVRGLNVVVEDIAERKRSEVRTRLLIDELNHRVKNTLSIVQNLARQSFRNGPDSSGARDAFEHRLLALAAAHNVLTERRWEAADLREVASTALGATEPEGQIHLCWREHGGPAVAPPTQRGFGSRLLDRAMDGAPGGDAKLSFARSGVRCAIKFRASPSHETAG